MAYDSGEGIIHDGGESRHQELEVSLAVRKQGDHISSTHGGGRENGQGEGDGEGKEEGE